MEDKGCSRVRNKSCFFQATLSTTPQETVRTMMSVPWELITVITWGLDTSAGTFRQKIVSTVHKHHIITFRDLSVVRRSDVTLVRFWMMKVIASD